MGPSTARISSTIFQTSVLAEFCSALLANKKHFLLFEKQEEQTSCVQQDLGGCLLVGGLRDVSSLPTFECFQPRPHKWGVQSHVPPFEGLPDDAQRLPRQRLVQLRCTPIHACRPAPIHRSFRRRCAVTKRGGSPAIQFRCWRSGFQTAQQHLRPLKSAFDSYLCCCISSDLLGPVFAVDCRVNFLASARALLAAVNGLDVQDATAKSQASGAPEEPALM